MFKSPPSVYVHVKLQNDWLSVWLCCRTPFMAVAILIRACVTMHKRWGGALHPHLKSSPLRISSPPPCPSISNSGQMHVACRDAQVQSVEGELKWGSEESLQLCNCDIVTHAGVGCSGDAATVVTDVPITTQHLAPVSHWLTKLNTDAVLIG